MANDITNYDVILKDLLSEIERGMLTDAQQNDIAMVGATIVEKSIRAERNFVRGYSQGVLDVASTVDDAIVGVVNVGVTEYYGFFVERGTPTQPAQPFFQPGLKKSEEKAKSAMADEYIKIIK